MKAQSEALKETVERLTTLVNGSRSAVHRAAGRLRAMAAGGAREASLPGQGRQKVAGHAAGRGWEVPQRRLSRSRLKIQRPAGYYEKLRRFPCLIQTLSLT